MIRLLIIISVLLIFVWLISEIIRSKKKNIAVKKFRVMPLFFILGVVLLLIFILPRFGVNFIGLLRVKFDLLINKDD